MFALLVALSAAQAESPGVLPKGSEVVYAGAGLSTFNELTQNGEVVERDREIRPRLDLYGALSPVQGLQVAASIPVVASWVADDPDLLPCPDLLTSEGYCDSYVTAGQARLDARYGVVRKRRGKVTLGLAADIDNWNASRRGQYNSAGSGRTMLEALAIAGGGVDAGGWTLRGLVLGAYGYSLAPSVTPTGGGEPVKAPGDTVRGSVELRANAPGPVAVEVGGHVVQRLTGVDLDEQWVSDWFASSLDRWNVLQYRGISVSGKVSIDLPDDMGLHVGLWRTVAVENGATNATDVTVGWHRYFAP